ncbi:maleylacetoacetate isomerase [Pseudomonas sp. PDNC002]|uniref:maleylacetoacetate isomerase n=1 Tax=Pseudomonas sp. PDNC002 TaxID=2811422 RepID=UPI00196527DF|nr:maleylacetoacetate isomerase [Pseudomonas sp. PDNC002]QRY78140.1 maleylacetoacetate isomerase [Pseudomonas sp. PDNC002]
MQLYSFFNSSTSFRVRIAAALKGLHLDYHGINLRSGEQHSSQHRERSPLGGVPVLVDSDGFSVTQSLAIIDYLDTLYPEPRLIPLEQPLRARVLEVANLIACDIHPINNLRVLRYLQHTLGISTDQKDAWYAHWIEEGLGAVEELLRRYGSTPYCFGESPTLADCCLTPQVANALRFGVDLGRFERCLSIYRHCLEQPGFTRAAPFLQPDYVP